MVKAQNYGLVQRSLRAYTLLPQVTYIVINHMVRVQGINFNRSRRSRGSAALEELSEEWHNAILESLCVKFVYINTSNCEIFFACGALQK